MQDTDEAIQTLQGASSADDAQGAAEGGHQAAEGGEASQADAVGRAGA